MSVTINDKYAKPGGGLKGKIPFKSPTGQRYGHIPEAVYNILNKYGSDAHLYTFGPGVPILGPELVVNGDFSNGATGWGQPSSGSASVSNGAIRVTGSGGSWPLATQNVTVVIGKKYALSGYLVNSSGISNAALSAGGGVDILGKSLPGSYSLDFVATTSNLVVGSGANGILANGAWVEWDNISVREILGYSNTYSGFVAGNYFDSAGTTLASVDGSVGLVLDAAGSVGAELITNGDFSQGAAGWGFDLGWNVTSGAATKVGASGANIVKSALAEVGKTYCVTYTITRTAGAIFPYCGNHYGTPHSVSGTYTQYLKPTSGTDFGMAADGAFLGTVDNISVREVTGIHATQSTPGYKPTLRKGIVNLLTASDSTASATFYNPGVGTWIDNGLVSVPTPYGATQVRKITVTGGPSRLRWGDTTSGLINTAYTGGLWVATADGQTRSAEIYTNLGGTFQAITVTPTFQLFAQSGSNNGVNTHRFADLNNLPVGEYYIGRIGIFQGTLTAAQILANGGIPLTTTAPASSVAGPNYLEFDGDDSLTLSGPLFQMADDHCVVLAFTPQKLQAAFSAPSYSGNNRFGSIGTTSGGQYVVEWYDGTNYVPHATPCVLGETVVITAWKVGGNLIARKNGVQFGSSAAFSTSVQATTGAIGTGPLGASKGRIYANPVVKGTLTLADVQLLEKQAAAAAGIQL